MLPVSLAAFHVARLWIESGVSPFSAVRALLAVVVLALIVSATSLVILRQPGQASLAATFALFGLLAWPVFPQLAVAGLLIVLVVGVLPRVLKTPFPWRLVTPAGNALALILMLTLGIRAAQNGTLAQLPNDIGWAVAGAMPRAGAQAGPPPDIYLLMLEDYPRADVLERVFGYDNGPFLSALEDRGFVVSARARSNYANSALTLLTMFQARHIEDIRELDDLRLRGVGDRYPLVRALTNAGPVLDLLRDRGYTIIATDPGYEQLTVRAADRFFASGHLDDFEREVLQASAFAPLADAIGAGVISGQLRDRTHAQFAYLSTLAREGSDGPRFVFVHVPVPHPPVVFGPNGEPVDVRLVEAYFAQLADPRFGELYTGQVQYLNGLVLKAVDELGAAARPSLVIVMSDEGMGFILVSQLSDDQADTVRYLFAARAPGREDLFGQAGTAINVFPTIAERYLGGGLPRRSDRNYISSDEAPFAGYEIPNSDAEALLP